MNKKTKQVQKKHKRNIKRIKALNKKSLLLAKVKGPSPKKTLEKEIPDERAPAKKTPAKKAPAKKAPAKKAPAKK